MSTHNIYYLQAQLRVSNPFPCAVLSMVCVCVCVCVTIDEQDDSQFGEGECCVEESQ